MACECVFEGGSPVESLVWFTTSQHFHMQCSFNVSLSEEQETGVVVIFNIANHFIAVLYFCSQVFDFQLIFRKPS